MKKIVITLLLIIVVLRFQAYSQQIALDNVVGATPGTEVLVSASFTEMTDIGSITLYIFFDETVASYVEIVNVIPELATMNFGFLADPPTIICSWFDVTGMGVDMPEGPVFDIKFNYVSGETVLEFADYCEVSNSAFEILNIDYTNGSISGEAGDPVSNWNGTGNWSDEQFWSNGIPGSETVATIETGNVNIFSGATCKELVVNSDATVNIHPNFFLIVMDNVTIEGEFNILSDATGTGSFIPNGTVNGNVNVDRFLAGDGSVSHFFSSPVIDITANQFSGQAVFSYRETDQTWNELMADDILITGKGYEIRNSNNNTLTFSGEVITEMVSLDDLTYTSGGEDMPDGLNLAGNPYTTAITWNEGDWDKNSINATIYTWKENNYVCWNGTIGALKNGIIPAMQGFFVVTNNSSPLLTIPLNSRVQNNQPYYKEQKTATDMLSFRLKDSESLEDISFIRFNPDATHDFDNEYDGFKLFGSENAPQLYTYSSSGIKLSLNEFPKPTDDLDTSFKVGYKVPSSGEYTLERLEYTIFSRPIYLNDKIAGTEIDFKIDSVYTFTSDAGEFNNRFEISFSEPSNVNENLSRYVSLFASRNVIHINTEIPLNSLDMKLIDLSGRIVYYEELPSGLSDYNIEVEKNLKGIFIVSLTSEKGMLSSKVFMQ